ncbi:hypothetical protein V2E24_01285 [Mycoplasmopsis ciconiae]|uniref:Uncharacterized protein n=1 Tax=Mycoplasmopsis ciconiae TaxID=561067 RepID=A0ABU7MKZ7_9BACT|nr:hypothetical protein [Mycoplasmopsis ciconiae]
MRKIKNIESNKAIIEILQNINEISQFALDIKLVCQRIKNNSSNIHKIYDANPQQIENIINALQQKSEDIQEFLHSLEIETEDIWTDESLSQIRFLDDF